MRLWKTLKDGDLLNIGQLKVILALLNIPQNIKDDMKKKLKQNEHWRS